jgi:hypothetical protein
MTTLISLVSDQTLPNVLFIEAVKKEVDLFIFLVTSHTEKGHKTDTIIKACQLEAKSCQRVFIDPESYPAIIEKLEREVWDDKSSYLVNITGGTKMMALAAKDFFEKLPNVESFYIPVGHQKAYSLKVPGIEILLPELTLKQYLLAHAYTFTEGSSLQKEHYVADELFIRAIKEGHPAKVPDIILRKMQGFFSEDKQWYMGDWFEEWLYIKIKNIVGLPKRQIAMKVKLKHFYSEFLGGSDNEFDVIFVKNNRLYIVEAKVFSSEKVDNHKLTEPLYKIASQRKTLGLHANAIVIILTPLWNIEQRVTRVNDMKKIFEINHVWDLDDMKDYQTLFSKF